MGGALAGGAVERVKRIAGHVHLQRFTFADRRLACGTHHRRLVAACQV